MGQGGRRWCPREQKPNGHGPRRRQRSHWCGLQQVTSLNPTDGCEENIRKQEKHTAATRFPSEPRWQGHRSVTVAGTGDGFSRESVRASLGLAPLVILKAEAWQALPLPCFRPQATDRASGQPPAQAVCPVCAGAVPAASHCPGHPRATWQLTGPALG